MELIVLRDGEECRVEIDEAGQTFRVRVGDRTFDVDSAATNGTVRSLVIEGRQFEVSVRRQSTGQYHVGHQGFIEEVSRLGFGFATLVHPLARVSRTNRLGEGTILAPGAILAAHASTGSHVIVNRGAMVGHHAQFGDFATVGPGANVAGLTRVGNRAFIGMGAIVKDHLTVGSDTLVGAGAVLLQDLPDGHAVYAATSTISQTRVLR